jgi:hypothetical protein
MIAWLTTGKLFENKSGQMFLPALILLHYFTAIAGYYYICIFNNSISFAYSLKKVDVELNVSF